MLLGYRDSLEQDEDLSHFTDRVSEQCRFEEIISIGGVEHQPVLAFHGAAGQGKSWLLKRLRAIAINHQLPTASITFDEAAGGGKFRHDFAFVLHEIRRELGSDCPQFDLAYAMYRYKAEGSLRPEFQGEGWLAGTYSMVAKLAECGLAMLPQGLAKDAGALESWLLQKLGDTIGPKLPNCAAGRWLLKQAGFEDYIGLLASDTQLILRELPGRLAEDLQQYLPDSQKQPGSVLLERYATCRAVIMFDGCEWLNDDAMLRCFCSYNIPVQLVLAGQRQLDWQEPYWRTRDHLEQLPLAGLPKLDAQAYLKVRDIESEILQNQILDACLEADGCTFHSLSIGWCADTVCIEREQKFWTGKFCLPRGDLHALAARFLRAMSREEQRWIESLALSPRFDEEAARWQYSETWNRSQDEAWKRLVGFSIVAPAGNGWYTLRPLARRAIAARLNEGQPEEIRRERERWTGYWSKRAVTDCDDFAELAWVQRWFLEPSVASEYWHKLTQSLQKRLMMRDHFRVVNWWVGTGIESDEPTCSEHAEALFDLGIALWKSTQGDIGGNLRRAIICHKAALQVFTEGGNSTQWAHTQNALGIAYGALPDGDRAANLREAIRYYEAALRVFTETAHPEQWAGIQNNLGLAFAEVPDTNRKANLHDALECYEAALRVCTESSFPEHWAAIQNNLGRAYAELPDEDRSTNLRDAVRCYEAALRILTESAFPPEWALAQFNLGNAYLGIPNGDLAVDVRKAMGCYEAALRVFTESAFPNMWAKTQAYLGHAYLKLSDRELFPALSSAIDCHKSALRVFTQSAFPEDWAGTMISIGFAYTKLCEPNRSANIRSAIQYYENALGVFTEAAFPEMWATAQSGLGAAQLKLQDQDRPASIRTAIGYFEAALRGFTQVGYPARCARIQVELGRALFELPERDRTTNLRKAIDYYESALQVLTESSFPQEWAAIQNSLGLCYAQLLTGNRVTNLQKAILYYEAALRTFTKKAFPDNHASVAHNLRMAKTRLKNLRRKI
jgi:tetratricopeptide (TPR) repeat protein